METFKKPKLKPKTYQSYIGYLRSHLFPAFGEKYFGDNLEAILLAMKGEGFVFGGEQPLSRKSYNTLMKHIEKKIDLHNATAHVLRHTFLTMAAGENIDSKTLQSMAGHGSYDMTMDTYVHPKKENVAKAGQMMDTLFGSYAEAV